METDIMKNGFIGLIQSFSIACWQQMGKVANPFTNKIERDVEQAKYSIDMIIMLREKTKGNLNKEEQDILNQTVSNLQINYIEELKKGDKATEEKSSNKQSEQNKKEAGK